MDAREYLLKKHNSPYQLKLLKIIESCTNIEQRSTVYSWLARAGKLRVPITKVDESGDIYLTDCVELLLSKGVTSEALKITETMQVF
jgi:hypothetical protein